MCSLSVILKTVYCFITMYMLDKQCFPYNSNVLECVVEIIMIL